MIDFISLELKSSRSLGVMYYVGDIYHAQRSHEITALQT